MRSIRRCTQISLSVIALFFFFALPAIASAATVSLSANKSTLSVGESVTVTVSVNSTDTAINNAEGVLSLSGKQFDVLSINKSGSLFSLWINAPSYDGDSSISFNGGLPSPGYQGVNGFLFSVTLRAKTAGASTVSLNNAAVRANDGLGTNVFTGANAAALTVVSAAPAPATPTAPPAAKPAPTPAAQPVSPSVFTKATVLVTSPTHPSQDAWYASRDAVLSFVLPKGATLAQSVLAKASSTVPTLSFKPTSTEKLFENLDDGVWYFNIRAKVAGAWTPVTSYRLQIDTAPPLLHATFAFDAQKQALVINASSSDPTSGVASYMVFADLAPIATLAADLSYALSVDGVGTTTLSAEQLAGSSVVVPLGVMSAGEHRVALQAIDHAGNIAEAKGTIFVPAAPSAIERVLGSLESGRGMLILVGTILILLLVSLLLNALLWVSWRREKNRPTQDIARIRAHTKQKLTELKRDIGRQAKLLSKVRGRKSLTPEDADYVKKMQADLTDAEQYIDGKIKDIG